MSDIEERLKSLERDSHPPVTDVPDADDVDRLFRELFERARLIDEYLLSQDSSYPHTKSCRGRLGFDCNCVCGEPK